MTLIQVRDAEKNRLIRNYLDVKDKNLESRVSDNEVYSVHVEEKNNTITINLTGLLDQSKRVSWTRIIENVDSYYYIKNSLDTNSRQADIILTDPSNNFYVATALDVFMIVVTKTNNLVMISPRTGKTVYSIASPFKIKDIKVVNNKIAILHQEPGSTWSYLTLADAFDITSPVQQKSNLPFSFLDQYIQKTTLVPLNRPQLHIITHKIMIPELNQIAFTKFTDKNLPSELLLVSNR